jgi:REP element-mobilizing transposase RayT
MVEHIIRSHNKTLLLYHVVFPVKYRRKIFTLDEVWETLKNTCVEEIANSYEIHFVEIGDDTDHVHFLIQSIPTLSVTRIVTIIKSITAKKLFKDHPEIKKYLWWWNFWTAWYYANTVSEFWNEKVIKEYIKNQWMNKNYKQIHRDQLVLFE